MGNFLSQSYFIAKPELTEKNLTDQSGKVFIVTGGYAGVGWQLTKILYEKNAKIYVAGRSKDKGLRAIEEIKKLAPDSSGKLVFLNLDLADLTTIKACADEFLAKETRLDVLWNNAGVLWPPNESKSAQGHELQMATNCLGPFLFTTLLQPILKSTASSSPSGSVRVCWASSLESDTSSPKGGIVFDDSGAPVYRGTGQQYNYGMSKAGNVFYASEWAKQYLDDGVVSVCFNPGNLSTELQRHIQFPGVALAKIILEMVLLYPAIYGAYTELWSGLSDRVTIKDNGAYIAPWGQVGQVRADIAAGLKTKEEGGSGAAAKFWDWSVKETKQYLS